MSSASVTRVSAWLRATSALAWSRRKSSLPQSGNSCSSVAPGASNEIGGSATAGSVASRMVSNASVGVRRHAGGDRESWLGMSLRLIDQGAAHGTSLALHLGAEFERPFAGHAGLDLKTINPRLIGRQGAHCADHLRHSARPHIGLALEQDGAGDRLIVRNVNKANRNGGFAGTRRLRLNQLEAVVVGSGEPVSRDQSRGCEDGGADEGARVSA